MILVLGGTTEGRAVVDVLSQGDGPYFYSTLGRTQQIDCPSGTRISGAMDRSRMEDFCRENGIRLIVDAAHPFAENLHRTVTEVAACLGLPVVRYERVYPPLGSEAILCENYEDAVLKMKTAGVRKLLALTGVQTIGRLRDFWTDRPTVFRILNREDSLGKAKEQGFPEENIVFYEETTTDELIRATGADAIITKESGESGGIDEKLEAARRNGVPVYVVKRPQMPDSFHTVTGRHGLRKVVERFCHGFFKLRSGFTTGSCATAAAKAALQTLLTGDCDKTIRFALPDGEVMDMPVAGVSLGQGSATASVIKDAGDDPDVIHGHEIAVTVAFAGHEGIRFFGGEGIGTVTLPGVGLAIGEPAINPVPRRMICAELEKLYVGGLDVTISVPGGAELALKTFNSRIGIVGGISIIGTTGVVMPFSHEAFMDAIRRQIEVAQAMNVERIVINSGARSEKTVRAVYPELPSQAFIHYGNAVGDTVRLAAEMGVKNLTIGIMIGKAVKLAEGHLDTHSKNVTLNREFLAGVARDCGCSAEAVATIRGLNMARELWSALNPADASRFFSEILRRCRNVCAAQIPNASVEALLISDGGEVVAVAVK